MTGRLAFGITAAAVAAFGQACGGGGQDDGPFHGPIEPWDWEHPCRIESDYEIDGLTDYTTYFVLDDRGVPVQEHHYDAYGLVRRRDDTYDGDRLVHREISQRGMTQVEPWGRQEYEWDGDLVVASAYDGQDNCEGCSMTPPDGVVDSTLTWEYDDRGRLVRYHSERAADVLYKWRTHEYRHDDDDDCYESWFSTSSWGFSARATATRRPDCYLTRFETDDNDDGTIDYVENHERAEDGRPIRITTSEWINGVEVRDDYDYEWQGNRLLSLEHTDQLPGPYEWWRDTYSYECPDGIPSAAP